MRINQQKFKSLLSGMYLDIITGDVNIRSQYMNTFLTHIAVYIRFEKLEPLQTPIARFRTSLHNTVSAILHNTHPLPAHNTKREEEIAILMKYFDAYAIRIDEHVADELGIEQIQILESIEKIEHCRNVCYSASMDYAESLAGNTEGLTNASNKYAYVINEITPILYRFELIDITHEAFDAAKIAEKTVKR